MINSCVYYIDANSMESLTACCVPFGSLIPSSATIVVVKNKYGWIQLTVE